MKWLLLLGTPADGDPLVRGAWFSLRHREKYLTLEQMFAFGIVVLS